MFKVMICGWLLCNGRRTISRVWETTGLSGKETHTRAYRLFSYNSWNWNEIGEHLIRLILKFLVKGDTISVVIDDTLCHKRGHKVAFGGMFRDPVLRAYPQIKTYCKGNK